MRRPYPLLAILALSALPLAAQPKPGPPPPQVEQAVQKYQGGDLKGAIALLEPLKGKPGAHPAALSLLGTLYLEAGRPKESLALLGPLADDDAAGPVILHNAARAALVLGQTAKAEAYLERAMAKAPVSPASRDLGILRGSQGRIVDGYRLLRPWALAHLEDQEARLAAAYGAIELDRAPEAEELLKDLPADNARARLLRGRLQLIKREPRSAIATLEPLLKGGPPALDLDVRRYLAQAYLAVGESGAAVSLLQGKVGKDPSLAVLLARAHYQVGDAADAAAVLEPFARDLLAREPAIPAERSLAADVALEYGQALVATSKWTEAIAALERATRLNPSGLQAWQSLGRAQLAAGRREEAETSLARFRELQSAEKSRSEQVKEVEKGVTDPTGRNLQKARSLAAAGRTDEALALIRQEIGLAPSDPRPRAAEVTTLLAAKRNEEALKAAEAAVGTAPGNLDFLYLRGAVRMALRQLAEAEKDYRQVLQARPDHVAAMNDLAVLLIAGGRKDEARELLRKVLEIRPGDPVATANLKSLEQP
ncbi:MAG TPA: tetratricopeptide repeat protein [Thermoanaerobaculia bacterium]|jgi:Flp pilus assembly protein TadD